MAAPAMCANARSSGMASTSSRPALASVALAQPRSTPRVSRHSSGLHSSTGPLRKRGLLEAPSPARPAASRLQEVFASVPSTGLVLVVYCKPNCGPCYLAKKTLEELEAIYGPDQVHIVIINTDEDTDLASRSRIQALPTFVFHRDNAEIYRVTGYSEKIGRKLVGDVKYYAMGLDRTLGPR